MLPSMSIYGTLKYWTFRMKRPFTMHRKMDMHSRLLPIIQMLRSGFCRSSKLALPEWWARA
jgi:hypothetical protein